MTLENSESVRTDPPPTQTIEGAIDQMPRLGLSKLAVFGLVAAFCLGLYESAIVPIALPSMTAGLNTTATALAWAISLNLVGFAIGAYVIGYFADRFGRQVGLRLTFTVVGVGSLLSAVAWDAPSLTVFRFIAGCGMGAVLALITGYIGEMTPSARRGATVAKISLVSTVLIVIISLAAVPVIAAAPLLSWRILIGLGALSLLLLPFINKRDIVESPRWLVEHSGLDRAAVIVRKMESRARGVLTPETTPFIEPERLLKAGTQTPFVDLFSSRVLVRRLVIVTLVLFFFYVGFFGISTYLVLFLQGAGIDPAQALSITAVSRVASLAAAVFIIFVIDRIERKLIIAIGTVMIIVGVILVVAGLGAALAMVGACLLSFGTGSIAPAAYTYVAEIFPTRVRGTGTSLADGFGHLGGAAAPFIILPILVGFGPIVAGISVIVVMALATILISFGVKTNKRSLEDIAV